MNSAAARTGYDDSVTTDFELLDAWAGGDRRAARALFDRHVPRLFRFLHDKAGDAVDDLVQETLLACLAARDRFRRDSSFRAYLFGIARNVLFQHLRKCRRDEGELDLETSCLRDLGPSPSSMLAEKAQQRLLLEALRAIPVADQVLVELYHVEEMTAIELASMYGISETAIRGRLHRAKKLLRERMESLAGSPEVLDAAWSDFETWARELQDRVEATTAPRTAPDE